MTTNPIDCTRCNRPHPRCNGHNKQGEPCMRWPRRGATVCPRHGGKAPQVVAAAERRRQAEDLALAAKTYGTPIEIDPATALLQELHRTQGIVVWLGALIAELEKEAIVWNKAEETDRPITDNGGGGLEVKHKAVPHVLVQLYQTERAHLLRVAKDTVGVDAAGRLMAVWDQVGQTCVQLIERVLGADELELTAVQRAAIPGLIVRELQALPEIGGGQ